MHHAPVSLAQFIVTDMISEAIGCKRSEQRITPIVLTGSSV